jgi:tetratricopeptide (TPR) repeat protein
MKAKTLVRSLMMTILLASWSAAGPLVAAALAQEQAQQASPWKDRAEYDAFTALTQATDPNQQIQLADKYLADYPGTKLPDAVYQLKLQAYQSLNDTAKMEETATKLLEISPNNIRGLLVLSYLFPRTINDQDPEKPQKLEKAAERAKRGLDAIAALPLPQGMSAEDFQKQKDQTAAVFHQTSGFVALQKADYPTATQELRKSAETNPMDALGFYWLGLAHLTPKPPNYDDGVYAMARASSITGATALPDTIKNQVKDYLTQVYEARHGSNEGLDNVLTQAASSPFPPAGFHIESVEEIAARQPPPEPEPPPPPQRELTVKAEELTDFGVIVKYLQSGGDKEADTWTILKGASLPLPGKVVSATPAARPTRILVAVAPELQAENGKHDVELTLAAPHARALPAGQMINFEGTLDAYTPRPFLLKIVDGKITP